MRERATNERTCNRCGWVHFGLTRAQAEEEVNRFNAYFDRLSEEKQQDLYGGKRSSIAQYEQCFNCGEDYKNFRLSRENDCPDGCTIQPIVLD